MEDGERVQQLRALVVLPENPGSVPSTHTVTHNHLNTGSRGSKALHGSNAFFWTLWVPGTHMVHICPCRQTLIHIRNKGNKSKDTLKKFKLGILGHTFNPRTQEAEAGRSPLV